MPKRDLISVEDLSRAQIEPLLDSAESFLPVLEREIKKAPFGCIGRETAFSVLYGALVGSKAIDLGALVTRMSTAPARIAGLPAPSVRPGAVANLCVADPKAKWMVRADGLQSRSFNSPWLGHELTARVKLTVAVGRVAWEDVA